MKDTNDTPEQREDVPADDLRDYFASCEKEAESLTEYRGIRRETLRRFGFGIDRAWVNPKPAAEEKYTRPSARAIIPTGPDSYLARALDDADPLPILKAGPVRLFNAACLGTAESPIFVVEGEIDALSVIDAGGEAVGLGSANNGSLLIDCVKAARPSRPLILAFDCDEDPRTRRDIQAQAGKLADALEELGIPHMPAPPELYCGCKDANELLQQDRGALEREVRRTALTASLLRGPFRTAASELPAFVRYVDEQRRRKPVLTGFPSLDEALGGGLYCQLYVLGAQSSLGKSTLALQIADQLSAAGDDVIYYSLEMSARFLQAKSLSRTSCLLDCSAKKDNSFDANRLLRGDWLEGAEAPVLRRVLESYRPAAAHLILREGFGGLTIRDIESDLAKAARYGMHPAVILDYLQILRPPDGDSRTEKQVIDEHVRGLWTLAHQYDVPILCISSLNRTGYDEPVVPGSFKESGGIEYTADVLIGMQFHGIDYEAGEKQSQHQARVRELIGDQRFIARQGGYQELDVKILKNRFCPPCTVQMRFSPRFNHFTDAPAETVTVLAAPDPGEEGFWEEWLAELIPDGPTEAPHEADSRFDYDVRYDLDPYPNAGGELEAILAQFPRLRDAETDEDRVAEALKIFDGLTIFLRDVTWLTALSEARARRALTNLGWLILPDGTLCR